ncbi:hypothetical protein CICLE_v10024341mg, partial [Citrus x clementina]
KFMCYARSSIRSTIHRYKKACSDNSNSGTVTEINAQYYQQESAKLRQQIQILQNSNYICNSCHFENNLLLCLFPKIEFLQKREVELENESVRLLSKIAEMERFQQANMATGQELNAILALASRNFFSPAIIEGGGSAHSHPDKKILHPG